jgi:hypothetical protein
MEKLTPYVILLVVSIVGNTGSRYLVGVCAKVLDAQIMEKINRKLRVIFFISSF